MIMTKINPRQTSQTGAGLLLYVLIMGIAITLAFSTYLIILTRSTQQTYANLRAELTYQAGFSSLQDTVLQLLMAQESQTDWPPLTQNSYQDQLVQDNTTIYRQFRHQDLDGDGQAELVIDIRAENQQISRQLQGIYLPPEVESEPLDIMLVIDVSDSMNQSDITGGDTKLDKARQAAQEFVEQFQDYANARIGLISYSTQAEVKSELKYMQDPHHYQDLLDQIENLSADGSTNIAAAIDINLSPNVWTQIEADDPPRYLVLLTDGLPTVQNNPDGSTTRCIEVPRDQAQDCLDQAQQQSLEAAEQAKSGDYQVEIFTIGLGQEPNIDQNLLRQLSSDESDDHYFHSPTSDQLSQIYHQIAKQITGYGKLQYYEVIPTAE